MLAGKAALISRKLDSCGGWIVLAHTMAGAWIVCAYL